MLLTWYGHACFKLSADAGSVVLDPYEKNYIAALTLPKLSADEVICSHGHGDHCAASEVTLTGRTPAYKKAQLPCWHDEVCGAKRGSNLITVIEAEGLRVAHCGDLGHELSDTQLALIGELDVLLIPVGGVYTVDAVTAKKIVDALRPKTVVPMHYKMGARGLQNVAPVEDFLALFDASDILRLGGNTWEIGEIISPVAVFELC